jgi:multiple sugar transport system permease protein
MATATAEPRNLPAVSGDGHKHKKSALSDGQARLAWMLLAPTLIIIIVVAGIPVIMSIRESFFATNSGVDPVTGLVAGGEQFVGLQNYTGIFTSPDTVTGTYGSIGRFSNAFWNTTFLTIVCVILETILGVAMALIMAKAFRGRGIVRAGILVPWAIPTIVSALMWKLIFDASGVANRITGQEILWLAGLGLVVLGDRHRRRLEDGSVHRAADPGRFADDPAEVYEAGKVDGATGLAAVRAHHPADGQADPRRGGTLPHTRHPSHVRPAVRHDRRRQVSRRDIVDLCVQRGDTDPVRSGRGVRHRPVPVRPAGRFPVRQGAGR